jgi:pyridoxal phosphate enzyme (YggS family)
VSGTPAEDGRREELAASLARVEARIAGACDKAGRPRADVTLIVVTKTYPASDVRLLAGLGVREVAENRDQEAGPKAAELAGLPEVPPLTWHFVGQLQTNKVRSVLRYADVVHSVDRLRLVDALAAAVARSERFGAPGARPARELGCLVQVALDAESGERGARGGVAPEDVPALADAVAAAPGLRLDGVMTVAPLAGAYAGRPRAAFERLANISTSLRAAHPAATMVSAGMSGDLEEAVAAGATHVRIGSAVLGVRSGLG